jgi:phosphopantothenoylcysteine synthetase/decarboxylase
MRILVTAGNTQTPIDKVRCITNIFTGRTGAGIALRAYERGHHVTLLTSHPELVAGLRDSTEPFTDRWHVGRYRTFDDLQIRLSGLLPEPGLDAFIHSAAVSDYRSDGIFAPTKETHFDPATGRWSSQGEDGPALTDMAAGKVKSSEPELWLRLVRTPKLVDMVRSPWGFSGILVKFKLEVGVSEERLLEIAEASRRQSAADLMVANTLEGANYWAYLGPMAGGYQRLGRRDLADQLLDAVERLHQERRRG